jgi:hypothetical protein
LNISRRLVARWLRHCWLREINGKISVDSIRRFCRVHPDHIPYDKLDRETQGWLRGMGYSPALEDVKPNTAPEVEYGDAVAGVSHTREPEYARP